MFFFRAIKNGVLVCLNDNLTVYSYSLCFLSLDNIHSAKIPRVDDKQDKFVIWDSPSHPWCEFCVKYHINLYTEGVISVYDISNFDSFCDAVNELEATKQHRPFPQVLVGNKADLPGRMVKYKVIGGCLFLSR